MFGGSKWRHADKRSRLKQIYYNNRTNIQNTGVIQQLGISFRYCQAAWRLSPRVSSRVGIYWGGIVHYHVGRYHNTIFLIFLKIFFFRKLWFFTTTKGTLTTIIKENNHFLCVSLKFLAIKKIMVQFFHCFSGKRGSNIVKNLPRICQKKQNIFKYKWHLRDWLRIFFSILKVWTKKQYWLFYISNLKIYQ